MPNLTPLVPKKEHQRADFSYTELRRHIFKYGIEVKWEMAAVCPCARKLSDLTAISPTIIDTREPRPDCPTCDGKGYVYHSPQTIRAIVHDASQDPDRWAVWGEHAAGSVTISLLPEHVPSFLDKFTVLDSVFVYRERKEKSDKVVESLRYPVIVRDVSIGSPADPTEELVVTRGVLHCMAADLDGVVINKELIEGVDFEITDTGTVDWSLGQALGTAPAIGAYYTVQYYSNPVYVARSMPYNYRDIVIKTKTAAKTHQELPTKVLAWLEFLGSKNAED